MRFRTLFLTLTLVSAAFAADKEKDILENLRFRNLGPAVGGGRVTAVAGIPGKPGVYYAGAAAGGIFKTLDGGFSWTPIFEKEAAASIGALALAPSNPSIMWVGTGEANLRNDIVTGHGVYFSPDGGQNWQFKGLADVGQISTVIIHPTNPDIVLVGAIGHAWGPNTERGVFRTADGGKTWQKTLYVDDSTGVADMTIDPTNPLIVYAGMWHVRRTPWYLDSGGESSGLYRSTDGGVTWTKLTEGLPKGVIGRIGVAVARSNPSHVYALIEAKNGRLWESRDYGDHWAMVSDRHVLAARGFYFTKLQVSPDNENRVYFLSFNVLVSDDGGRTSRDIGRGVHPDHHALWIDPTNPERMIEGNDGGVYITQDMARNWRYLDNLPIEQFYMVASDEQRPYTLCGGLQDNNGWCGPVQSLKGGAIQGGEWWTAAGGDGEYIVPTTDGKTVYADSQNGHIARLDRATGVSQQIRPYYPGVEDFAPSDLKYRFNWTSPIAVDTKDPQTVYIGGNVLFRSTDGGKRWTAISGDLTRNDKEKQKSSGGQVQLDLSGAETYDTILSLSVSPADPNVIWVGTDDGLVQMTKDGGKSWQNVTPKGAPEWGKVQQIDASPFDANSAYVALDLHEIDNNKPYVFRTHDGGKTWTAINKGLPETDPARVVREDPNQKGFLTVGTDTGLFYSANDGDTWTPLKSNFPTTPVYDIKYSKPTHDLIVATHGRGLFVLDNIRPIEELAALQSKPDFKLFSVQDPIRWAGRRGGGGGFGGAGFVTPNPPNGTVLDYYLAKAVEGPGAGGEGGPAAAAGQGGGGGRGARGSGGSGGQGGGGQGGGPGAGAGFGGGGGGANRRGPVKVVITDAAGNKIRTFYGQAQQGVNRIQWDGSYDPATPLERNAADDQAGGGGGFRGGFGPQAAPGKYTATVTVNGQTQTASFELKSDPRINVPLENFQAQTRAALEARDLLSAMNSAINRLETLHTQLTAVQRFLGGGGGGDQSDEAAVQNAAYRPVLQSARQLDRKLRTFQDKVYNSDLQQGGDDSIHYLSRFHDRVQSLMGVVGGGYGQPPTELAQQELSEVRAEVSKFLGEFNALLKADVADFNKLALDKGANTLFAGAPIELKHGESSAGGQDK